MIAMVTFITNYFWRYLKRKTFWGMVHKIKSSGGIHKHGFVVEYSYLQRENFHFKNNRRTSSGRALEEDVAVAVFIKNNRVWIIHKWKKCRDFIHI
jgi:hypothetical protein